MLFLIIFLVLLGASFVTALGAVIVGIVRDAWEEWCDAEQEKNAEE